MASSRRHTRGAKIYYAESTESSDGDHSDSLYTSHAQDSATSTTQRTRRSMHQLNSTRPQRRGAPALRSQAHIEPRAKRSSHRQSYNDSTSSETSDEDIVLRTAKRRKAKPSVATHSPYPRKLKQSLRNHNVAVRTPPRPIESDGKNPVWQRLPYEVLLSIFRYSIHPLHGEDLKQTLSVNWAVQAARICKAFSEPVLTALYESPPLHFLDQPFGLLNLLKVPGPKMIDYQVKIKSLQMAAKQTLAYSAPGRGLFAITDLLAALPQLQDLDISGPRDRPPFFTTTNHGAWNYPQDMFTVMSSVGMKLKRFHLNGDMLQSADGARILEETFTQPCLQRLEHLKLSNIILDRAHDIPKRQYPSIWPTALAHLRELRSLGIHSCSINSAWSLLDSLPNNLRKLSIANCPDLSSFVLSPYLETHGHELLELELHHNNGLDLSFLPNLANCCPNLQALRMNLTYYSNALVFKSSSANPMYDTLLRPGDTPPTWPRTLQQIELLNLRNWGLEPATTFFQSLQDVAGDLPDLRFLTIKAMLNTSWKERACFRDKWISKLERSFLRRSEPPNPHLTSLKAYRLWQEGVRTAADASNSRSRTPRKTRTAQAYTDTEEEDIQIQGLCEKVDIGIDNKKPSEVQFTAEDFMDSELSGDEDWNAADDGPSSPQYAW